MMIFQMNYRWWKKRGLGRIMKDKKIISMRQIREDLVSKQKKWWYFEGIMDDGKKMGLERIMEDKKIISMRQIMEDLVNKKMKIFQMNYGWWKKKGVWD